MGNFEMWKDSVGRGWQPMVHALLVLADKNGLEVSQVKEKFGALRFYWGAGEKGAEKDLLMWFDGLVKGAEGLSHHMCEECGLPGKTANHGGGYWLKTLCPICSEKHRREQEPPK